MVIGTENRPIPSVVRAATSQSDHAGEQVCAHCGLPVQCASAMDSGNVAFCCHGCRVAYELIVGGGLAAFYELSSDFLPISQTATANARRYPWFDDAEFLAKFARTNAAGSMTIELAVEGIHCAGCVWLLEKLPRLIPGVIVASVNWAASRIHVEWDPNQTSLSQIAITVAHLGYPPYPVESRNQSTSQFAANRQQLVRLAVAGALAGNNMLIALALYLGMFSGMADSIEQLLRFASGSIGVLSLLWPGRVFLAGAVSALRTRTPHMDLPIALGVTVGTVSSLVNTFRGVGDVYFDSVSLLVFVLLLGRFVQHCQQRFAASAISLLGNLTPRWIRIQREGEFIEAPLDCLQVGELVEVRAGELLPADGVVESGSSLVDESILSGESTAVPKAIGDRVSGGSQNLKSALFIRVQATGDQTRIGQVVRLVDDAARNRPRIVIWADRLGAQFVVAILLLATATLGAWMFISPSYAVDRAVSLLIVACPCALALATPIAISVGLIRAARCKILIKRGDVFQWLSKPGMLWLDKTGTLTHGNPRVTRWMGDDAVLPMAAALQVHSSHPMAAAMCAYAAQKHLPTPRSNESATEVEQTEHGGIRGRVGAFLIEIGNEPFVIRQGVRLNGRFWDQGQLMLTDGISPIYVAVDKQCIGVAGVADALRSDAANVVERLRRRGWQIGILSGDHQAIVDRVAHQLNIPLPYALGQLSPEEKVRIVQNSPARIGILSTSTKRLTTVLVGDGVNDSAALAIATVGVAAHRSADACLAAAPVYLADAGLSRLVDLMDLSHATMRTIRRNLGGSLAYNVVAIGLAAVGLVGPLTAAILMPISSLTVVALSLLPAIPAPSRLERK